MAKHTSSEDIQGATPITAPADTQKKAPARGRKAKTRKAKLAPPAAVAEPDYAALRVPEEARPAFERAREKVLELGRLETAQVFECGEVIAALREHAPDQKTFGLWTRTALGVTRRGAENHASVFLKLYGFRERLELAAIQPTALYAMASAEPERVEAVLAAREQGETLTVKQIKAMLSDGSDGEEAASGTDPEAGGLGGLKALSTQKVASASRDFMACLFGMQRSVHIALERHRNGKRVDKGKAQDALVHEARLAKALLEAIAWTAHVPGKPYPDGVVHRIPLAREGRWYELRQLLDRMGGVEAWPGADKLGDWLSGTVVPAFDWALGESRAAKAVAVIDEMAKAAEAEKERAAKEKAKAKAAAKKEKARAGRQKLRDLKAETAVKLEASSAQPGDEAAKVADEPSGEPDAPDAPSA